MRNRKYPQPLAPEAAASMDPQQLPTSSRPTRSVKHRTDAHGLHHQARLVLAHPSTYALFDTVPLSRAAGAYPAALYSALQTLLGVFLTQPAVLRELNDSRVLQRTLQRALIEFGHQDAALIIQRRGLPSRSSWQGFLDLMEIATAGDPDPIREQFRLAALRLALSMGHFDPASESTILSRPDARAFATADGTVLKSPSDNGDHVVYDAVRGEARTKRVDPSRSRHHEGGQSDEGNGVTVYGTKFVMIHSHGPQWQNTVTLDLAHDSEPRPGRVRGEPGSESETELTLSMFYRLAERELVDETEQTVRPYVAGLVYDKALRGVHAQQLTSTGHIAVAEIVKTRQPDGTRDYREMVVDTRPCENVGEIAPGQPGHVHVLVAKGGRIYERHGSELREPLGQRADRRHRVNGTTLYREITIGCPYGDPHTRFIPILPPPLARGERPRRDTRERGEYLRIFAPGEDTYNAVKAHRPTAENRNSELDRALPDKRIPAWGVFRQTLYLIGLYTARNIVNHHYVTAHNEHGDCLARPDEDGDITVYLTERVRPIHAHRHSDSRRRVSVRPSVPRRHTRPTGRP